MQRDIESRYQLNLRRVRRLVSLYRELAGSRRGRRSVETVDLLRSAVVFLHATLEDVLRTLLLRRWALSTDASQFNEIPIVLGVGFRAPRVTLGDLAAHRDKTVEQLVQASIEAHLERATFNRVGDVKVALTRIGVDETPIVPHASSISAMMSRRHQIVHRADRRDVPGAGNHAGASLGVGSVEAWIASVEAVCRKIVAQL